MDILLPAVASDLVGRLFSFLIKKYQERGATDTTIRLQRTLVRARVIVEEAEGRQIDNRAMLLQLNKLRQELCRAGYALDAVRWRATDPSRSRRSRTMMSRSLSQTRPALSGDTFDVLPVMVETMEAALGDMREIVVLLNSCPRLTKQPYSAYLFLERCMFGRQMEKEEVIGFLLKPSQELDVLPIIGPPDVGKRTLVEHVCLDERVRERFTEIHRLRSDELDVDSHGNLSGSFDFTARSLIVIDIIDANTDAKESWRRFHSAIHDHTHRGTKIIIICRTEAHLRLGTVPPLRLHPPRREELWYFFRALAFGAADPNERPDLLRIAMEMCDDGMGDLAPFRAANIVAASLGTADLSACSWRRVHKVYAEATMLQLDVTGDDFDAVCYLCQPVKDTPGTPCLFYNGRKLTGVAPSELPKVTMPELLTGSSLPLVGETRFDVLVWHSRIPPYVSYIATCDTSTAHHQHVVALKKRLLNKRRRDHHEDIGNSN
ncbi:hypothetical protein PR202_ga23050 [Eleusine coracana subsp. coracana]|uniref:Disease resistance N-terminal domain-containing protein n=1 Tax=Eleusine coracana subsp. coracana TaxID=191504 RepID=A0AAV5D5S6_ELECO|nr:hypothetical protein QOZ80_1AG0014630 [Eleusine coracana subsp. coracana]GJN05425.1 hypothetical protein PR202_ga23050 [Eleusine coracana subsp. coracana]